MPAPRPIVALAAAATVALGAGPATVALGAAPGVGLGFDPSTERVGLDGAALAIDFEDPRDLPVTTYDPDARPVEPTIEDDGAGAIEGSRSLRAGGSTPYVSIDLAPLREALIGRRVEITLWQRPLGTRLTGDLRWRTGGVTLAAITIQPTGNVTVDGWEEWTTGPVDFALGAITPTSLLLYDEQYFTALTRLDEGVRVALDALAVIDRGPARVTRAACRPADTRACGEGAVCAFGQCADAAAIVGAPLHDRALRRDMHARRIFEVEAFEGSRAARALAPHFTEAMRAAADAEPLDVAAYWRAIGAAYDALTDGHAVPPRARTAPEFSSGACAYLSEIDLTTTRGPGLMVFEASSSNPIGRQLRAGDVIVAIDDLAPAAWGEAHGWHNLSYRGDPAGRPVQLAPQLLDAALLGGARLTVERCAARSATSCETSTFEIDLAAELAVLVESGELDPLGRVPFCDFRFRRPVSDERVTRRADYAGFAERNGTREVQINGLPYDRDWIEAIDRGFASAPERLLLDQRLGNGGSIEPMALLVSRLVSLADLARAELWPPLPGDPERAAIDGCPECAGRIDIDFYPGSSRRGIAARAKLAVLDGRDLAGNDFTARAALSRREGQTRVFGPGPTFGAFGPRTLLPRLPGEVATVALQTHDAVFLAPDEDHLTFESGAGVVPHQRVLQRQSDALGGRDTILDAARAWLESP